MNHRERLETCLAGEKPDRVPVALWRHFPVDDQSPQRLARAVLWFQRNYDFDLVKVTPASSYCIRDWGLEDVWRGATEGTRETTRYPIQHPEDWARLQVLEPHAGSLGEHLSCLQGILDELGGDVPVLPTIFSPLAQARKLAGEQTLLVHLRRYPQALHVGLKTIAETTRRFVEALLPLGVAGVFFASQHAQYGLLSKAEFEAFGKAYDLEVLGAAKGLWLNMLHLHGSEVMFDLAVDYPVQVVNWHDRETFPSLTEGLQRFAGVVCGGLRRVETMLLGTPEQVRSEARQAIETTGGRRFILGTGCVLPITAPHGNILAARHVVEG